MRIRLGYPSGLIFSTPKSPGSGLSSGYFSSRCLLTDEKPPRREALSMFPRFFTSSSQNIGKARVSVWWDFENCVLSPKQPLSLFRKVLIQALEESGIDAARIDFFAVGHLNQVHKKKRKDLLHDPYINFIQVKTEGHSSLRCSLLHHARRWRKVNPIPAHIVLVSTDGRFAPSLRAWQKLGYNICLVSRYVQRDLCRIASMLWIWGHLKRGFGFSGRLINRPPKEELYKDSWRIPNLDPLPLPEFDYDGFRNWIKAKLAQHHDGYGLKNLKDDFNEAYEYKLSFEKLLDRIEEVGICVRVEDKVIFEEAPEGKSS